MSSAYRERHAKRLMVRLHNRRVIGYITADGAIQFHFRRLDGREIRGDNIKVTAEALIAMLTIAKDLGAIKHFRGILINPQEATVLPNLPPV